MPARRKSAWRLAASSTGVVSAKVTNRILVCFSALEPHHGSGDVHAPVSYLARDLTVISACCIEQQQGVPGLGSAGAGKLLLNALD